MDRSWNELTDSQKIQVLRDEMLLLGERVAEISTKHDAVAYKLQFLATLVHDLAKEVEKLKGR